MSPILGPDHSVLIVDDDAFLRMSLLIEVPDLRLLEAWRLDQGYRLAVEHRPDAVLLDRRLPDGDGIELIRRIRRNKALSDTPVLVITAGHDEADRPTMLRAGADEYLAKPIDPVDLRARIERLLVMPAGARRTRRAELRERLRTGEWGDLDPPPRVVDLTALEVDTRQSRRRR